MQQVLLEPASPGEPKWIDITEPDEKQLQIIAEKYNLHPLTVQDCLQTDHLPKFEITEPGHAFVIIRSYKPDSGLAPDNPQALSQQLSLFIGPEYCLSIHNEGIHFLDSISERLKEWKRHNQKKITSWQILAWILRDVTQSYVAPARKIETEIDYYESRIFLRSKTRDLLKSLYLLKRRTLLFRRLILLLRDPVVQLKAESANKHGRLIQDVMDRHLEIENYYEQLMEELNQLMNLYISLASQKTNDVMRILTIFSVFFLPLTFIVGVYGMNFRIMPELDWRYGYLLVWGIMILVTLMVFFWFKKRKWL